VDCEGHLQDRRVGDVLMSLKRACEQVRYLGSYPRADGGHATERPGTTDADFVEAADWLTRCLDGRG
jgi:prephenate dehydratase